MDRYIVTGDRPLGRQDGGHSPSGLGNARDPWLRADTESAVTLPPAGQPGHGRTATLRRQPAHITDGRMEGGYTDAFELICPCCENHPYLDYSEISPRLQWLRGPRTLMGLAAYEKHLGLTRRSLGTGSGPQARETPACNKKSLV